MATRLPRLERKNPVVDSGGFPSLQFHRDFDAFAKAIETAIDGLADTVTAIAAANAAAAAANAAASAANAAADDAATVAALGSSGVVGAVIDATDAGTDATISISAHTRVYGDGTSVSVDAGAVTGRAYATKYYVYYDDPSRTGGAVSYQTTTSETTAAQTGDRHLVGDITTPASGAADTDGRYVGAPGVGGIYQ